MDPARLNASLDQAERLLNQGSLHDAETIYREVLDELPGQPIASQGLGLIALHTGHASAAVELLQMAAIGQPDDAAYIPTSASHLVRLAIKRHPRLASEKPSISRLLSPTHT